MIDAAVAYKDFTERLRLLVRKQPELITMTLSNIFTMRLIGNKTHGDLAEIAISEFINMYDFDSVRIVGKDRAKSKEEGIRIVNEITKEKFSVSLKAYGDGPLQLSTDKSYSMFPRLEREVGDIVGTKRVKKILDDPVFADFGSINVLPLIYDEKTQRCNILIFDYALARNKTARISRQEIGKGRKHPVYRFYDAEENYICEVRYGDAAANALQRGLWTHTKNAFKFFDSNGWIDYSHNRVLIELFSHALVSSKFGHKTVLKKIKEDIDLLKQRAEIS